MRGTKRKQVSGPHCRKINEVIRFLEDEKPGEDNKSAVEEAAHGQTTEELTDRCMHHPKAPVRTQELLVSARPEATHPQ